MLEATQAILNHYAYYDCLSICRQLQGTLQRVSKVEIHLFAYLSCLLSLYEQQPVSGWGYSFAITEHPYPNSPALDEAMEVLAKKGSLLADGDYLTVTDVGNKELTLLSAFSINSRREPYLYGACSSILALPVGIISEAISQEPDIKGAITLSQSRLLLRDSGLNLLHEQFAELSKDIGVDVEDLMVPAIVWLSYLSSVRNQTEEKTL